MGLMRTLLIIAIIYFALRFIVRYLLPFLLTSYVNKKFNAMGNHTRGFNNPKKKPEGEVTIDFSSQNKKQNKTNKGDYVDFEEIKD
jgi:hypothetical protein